MFWNTNTQVIRCIVTNEDFVFEIRFRSHHLKQHFVMCWHDISCQYICKQLVKVLNFFKENKSYIILLYRRNTKFLEWYNLQIGCWVLCGFWSIRIHFEYFLAFIFIRIPFRTKLTSIFWYFKIKWFGVGQNFQD